MSVQTISWAACAGGKRCTRACGEHKRIGVAAVRTRSVMACLSVLSWARAWASGQLYLGVRRRRQLPCAVVSIGNLTLGGTGKPR